MASLKKQQAELSSKILKMEEELAKLKEKKENEEREKEKMENEEREKERETGLKKPIVKVGRVAGQYAKPRSLDAETIDGISLPAYRGDIVNGIVFDKNSRQADPQRLIDSYFYSAASLNHLRCLALGGYGNLEKVNKWNEEFSHSLTSKKNTEELISKINDHMHFMHACGLNSKTIPQLTTASFFTSHEALLLNYEEAFTRKNKDNGIKMVSFICPRLNG